jgi:hypothetical protein
VGVGEETQVHAHPHDRPGENDTVSTSHIRTFRRVEGAGGEQGTVVAPPTSRRTGRFRVVGTERRAMSEDGESESGWRELLSGDKLLLAVILLVGVAGSGIARRTLGELGYDTLGTIIYVLGYGGMVFIIWWGWIRPLDLTGPSGP